MMIDGPPGPESMKHSPPRTPLLSPHPSSILMFVLFSLFVIDSSAQMAANTEYFLSALTLLSVTHTIQLYTVLLVFLLTRTHE